MPVPQTKYAKPSTCAGCTLEHAGWGFAPPAGPRGARLTFIGEALGAEEAIHGEPFVGAAGGVLSRLCVRAGIDRAQARIANVVSCFPGYTRVHAHGLRAIYRRWYEGEYIRIKTTCGVLTGTPNHPVLTLRGYRPLGDLQEGDDLGCSTGAEWMSGRDPHVAGPPLRIDQAFNALTVAGIRQRMVGRYVDFHGDGRNGEIDVVRPDGVLWDWRELVRVQEIGDEIFEAPDLTAARRLGPRAGTSPARDFVQRWTATVRSLMGGREHLGTGDRGRYGPPMAHGGCTVAQGLSGSAQGITEALLSYPAVVGEGFDAVAAPIATACVLKVERFRRAGHVYTLSTVSEQFAAEGHIVHNCRPPDNLLVGASYEHAVIDYCRQYLDPVLAAVPLNGVVVPLGATALKSVLGLHGQPKIDVKDFHGTISRDPSDRFWVVPSFHPSHLQRGAMNLLDVVTSDLMTAARIAREGFVRSAVDLVVDPPAEWFAAWVAETQRLILADPDAVHIALDTEYAEKISGQDESEIAIDLGRLSPITRVNVASDGTTGITVPYRQPYIGLIEQLLVALQSGGWLWLWNKYADWEHLKAARHSLDGILALDAMWLWHYLQSDLPRGLGFVAAMASDFGPWKHWAVSMGFQGKYAAADAVQTWRTAMWLLRGAQTTGLWDVFLRDWHERDVYVLRPAKEMGVPVDRPELEAFHAKLQVSLGRILADLKKIEIEGVYKPKDGYARKPKGATCTRCDGAGYLGADEAWDPCPICKGDKEIYTPPATILGKPKKGGGEAKADYMREGIALVERVVANVPYLYCITCNLEVPTAKHRCKKVGKGKAAFQPVPMVETLYGERLRYFWRVPFNPDAAAQVIAYIEGKGIAAPIDKKTKKKTTAKAAMLELLAKHADDPFFQLKLDWAAVQKVDSTYAVGTLAILDANGRVHPEVLPKPSTLRDSCVAPNLQNVVADRGGADGLAAGFRRCVQAVDGVPTDVTADELTAWAARYPA